MRLSSGEPFGSRDIFPQHQKVVWSCEKHFHTISFCLGNIFFSGGWAIAADQEVLKFRVPPTQIAEAKTWTNPFPANPENIEKGKHIFCGQAFCVTWHGRDGKGLGNIPGRRGKLPRNFTDKAWQAVRTDGELFWILKNGSPETDMASLVPLVLTEDEAWYVLVYVRSFGTP